MGPRSRHFAELVRQYTPAFRTVAETLNELTDGGAKPSAPLGAAAIATRAGVSTKTVYSATSRFKADGWLNWEPQWRPPSLTRRKIERLAAKGKPLPRPERLPNVYVFIDEAAICRLKAKHLANGVRNLVPEGALVSDHQQTNGLPTGVRKSAPHPTEASSRKCIEKSIEVKASKQRATARAAAASSVSVELKPVAAERRPSRDTVPETASRTEIAPSPSSAAPLPAADDLTPILRAIGATTKAHATDGAARRILQIARTLVMDASPVEVEGFIAGRFKERGSRWDRPAVFTRVLPEDGFAAWVSARRRQAALYQESPTADSENSPEVFGSAATEAEMAALDTAMIQRAMLDIELRQHPERCERCHGTGVRTVTLGGKSRSTTCGCPKGEGRELRVGVVVTPAWEIAAA